MASEWLGWPRAPLTRSPWRSPTCSQVSVLRDLPRSSSEPTSLISLDTLCVSLGLDHGAVVGSSAVVGSRADVGAGAAGGVPEKRVDPSDGRSYTRHDFEDFYRGSWEVRWAAAKPSPARAAAGAAAAGAGAAAAAAAAAAGPSSPSSPLMTNQLTNPSPSIPPLDLIVLSCLMGNDYLPKVREARGDCL